MNTSTLPVRVASRSSLTAPDTASSISGSNLNNYDASRGTASELLLLTSIGALKRLTEFIAPSSRLVPGRKDTDVILSYYQSEDAGQVYTAEHAQPTSMNTREYRRRMSNASSPSEYSPDTDEESKSKSFQTAATHKPKAASQATRRPNTPSDAGSDRQRIATVDMGLGSQGKADQGKTVRKGSVRSRRGMDRLASVASSDASQKTYANTTPSSTAPLAPEKVHSEAGSQGHTSASHHRSSSEAASSSTGSKSRHSRKSSRNIGIVGTSGSTTTNDQSQRYQSQDPLNSPIFQIPQSRSPSPKAVSQSGYSDSLSSRKRGLSLKEEYMSTMSILGPDIGDDKAICQVASPISSNSPPITSHTSHPTRSQSLTKTSPRRKPSPDTTASTSAHLPPPFSKMPSSYLQYQPGVHAIAGPLPPPPRPSGSAPPPRPPRINSPAPSTSHSSGDLSSIKQGLQLPRFTKESLKAKLSNGSFSDMRSKSETMHSLCVLFHLSGPNANISNT